MQRYKTVAEMPAHYHKDAQKLVDLKIIRGRAPDNLDVTEDMVRCAIWFGRMTGVIEDGEE